MIHRQNIELFGTNCQNCSEMTCYADDGTVLHSYNSRRENQEQLIEDLDKINDYLNDNRLKINRDKTTILEVIIRQKRAKIEGQPPTLSVTGKDNNLKTLYCGKYTRLLGGNISNNLCWDEHLESGKKSILPRLRKQLGALCLLSRKLPRASRLLLSNGLFMSKVNNLTQV